jgi:hypothetical protein
MSDNLFGFFIFSITSRYRVIALDFELKVRINVPNIIVGIDKFLDISTSLQILFYAGMRISNCRTDQVNHSKNNVVADLGLRFDLWRILILNNIFLRASLFSS